MSGLIHNYTPHEQPTEVLADEGIRRSRLHRKTSRNYSRKILRKRSISAQLKVRLEKKFFHWITSRALNELVATGYLKTEILVISPKKLKKLILSIGLEPLETLKPLDLRFYRLNSSKSRYWKRRAQVKAKFVAAYTRSVLIHGLGPHGEMMVDDGRCGSLGGWVHS